MNGKEIKTTGSLVELSENEYPKILESYRQRWVRNLGIQNKPGVPCLKNDQMHTACLKIFDRCPSALAKSDLDAVLKLFSEHEECNFDESCRSVLEMLVPLRCNLDELYNIFCAITTKFVPRDISKGAVCYQLMHLIVQYHDPLLSSHLESYKVTSFEYGRPFFAALFAPEICKESLYVVWDKLFERGDPYLLFTMVLVFLINCSDQLMTLNTKSELIDTIRFAVKELSVDDVDDFFELSVLFLSQTPSSIKQDFQRVLFGSRHAEEMPTDIGKLLALPVDPRDVIRMSLDENLNTAESKPSFFIIDARSHDQYSAGHLNGSYNLDSTLFVEAPLQYKLALSSLDAYRCAFHPDEHILFLGSGREDDLYLHMVIASFLQQGRKHIALVDGGYKALHQQLAPNFGRFDGHYAAICKECNGQPLRVVEKDAQRKSSWKLDVDSIFGAVKATAPSIKEKVRKLPIIVIRGPNNIEFNHVATSQRHGKRYRNEKSLFTLSDSDSETETVTTTVTSSPRSSEPKFQKLDDVLKQNGILEYFEGLEVFTEGANHRTVECYLALTATHVLIFHQEEKIGEVILRARHAYGSVLRVSSKKKIPELLTFKFGYCTDENDYKVTAVRRFIIPRAGDCAKSIKTNIVTLQPNVIG